MLRRSLTVLVTATLAEAVICLTPLASAPAGAASHGIVTGHRSTRQSLPSESSRPGPRTTGVPDDVILTTIYGPLVIKTPGAHYDAMDVHGFVIIDAPNVTITRSIIRGGIATGNIGLVTNTNPAATGFVLEDSTLVPEHPSVWLDGVKGRNYTVRRVDISGTVDGAKIYGNHVRIEDSWIHDIVRYAHDPNHGGGPSHSDGVQVLGGRDIAIVDNTIDVAGAMSSGVQITQNYSPVSGFQFTGNWADGGGCTVNVNNAPGGPMSGITVTDNRFGHDTHVPNCAIIASRKTTLTAGENVWDDTNSPVDIRNGG